MRAYATKVPVCSRGYPMVRASAPDPRRGRVAFFVLNGLLIAGLLILVSSGTAQNPSKPPPKGDAPKLEPAKVSRVIVAKTPDVAEMTKVINEKVEETWKANKVTPSREVSDLEFLRRASLDIIGRVPT